MEVSTFVEYLYLWISYKLIFITYYNKNKEDIYCDLSGKIFTFLNRFWQESLLLHPTKIRITPFSILKILLL